ncbi:P1 family peptidase [Saxibacter everestensis]|uniref:P1 family peptidase n=1 Tax=Saxibacter everestensis TaxID=2909229 RepID=A0ABY8QNL4_9MICO|nr:P1 family peptidase [Brevibacteriaceae bacterium ZFBP1038]
MTLSRNPFGAITDVAGIRVGNYQRIGQGWLTGTTVLLPCDTSIAAIDVRGGGPATHETDALSPNTLVPTADALTLTGGSAYGLAAVGGVAAYCESAGKGYPALQDGDPSHVVPITPAAAIFDLNRGGDFSARPDAEFGRRAAEDAASHDSAFAGQTSTLRALPSGTVGAGTGAFAARGTLKGGLGTASVSTPDGRYTVGALVAANPAGAVTDAQGRLYSAGFDPRVGVPTEAEQKAWRQRFPIDLSVPHGGADIGEGSGALPRAAGGPKLPASNTTIAIVATNARLGAAQTQRFASSAHAGLARAIRPSHTLVDGDAVFGIAAGHELLPDGDQDRLFTVMQLCAMAADALMLAITDAILAATVPEGVVGSDGRPLAAYRDVCPSVLEQLA